MASIATFILQMTLHPDIQAKAHAELDRVVGKNTLPTFADESSLPYIGAIAKEVLRCIILQRLHRIPKVDHADLSLDMSVVPPGGTP